MKVRVYAIDSPTSATVKKGAVRPGGRLALPLVLLVAGCDALVGLATPGDDPTPTGACNDLYSALVTYTACLFPPAQLQPPRRDRFVLNCVQHLSAPGADSASAAAERCVAAIRAAASTCGTIDTTACIVPPGNLARGQTCGTAMQCASNYCLESAGATEGDQTFLDLDDALTSCGTCADRIQLGAPCQVYSEGAPCAPGAACRLAADAALVEPDGGIDDTGTCVALPSAPPPPSGAGAQGSQDAACNVNYECASLFCAPDSTCQPGGLTQGQACTTHGFELCAGNMTCNPVSLTCQPPVFVEAGAACNGFDIFCSTGSCSTDLGGNGPPPGTCPPVIVDGDPCPTPSGAAGTAVCDDYASCISATGAVDAGGACVLLDPAACH
jgi:hypothetical protein